MEISYLGHSSFLLKTKTGKLVTDQSGKIVIDGGSEPVTIAGPGEYEIKGFSITGIQKDKNTIYLIETEEIKLCHLGDQGAALTEEQIGLLEGVDVLFVPVGGGLTLDAKTAWQVTQSLSPRLVIPFAQPDDFVRESGLEPKKEKKLPVNKLNLPEETELVILER